MSLISRIGQAGRQNVVFTDWPCTHHVICQSHVHVRHEELTTSLTDMTADRQTEREIFRQKWSQVQVGRQKAD